MDSGCNETLHCMIPTSPEEGVQRWIQSVKFGKKRITVAEVLEELKERDRSSWRTMKQRIERVQQGRIRQLDLDREMIIAPANRDVREDQLNDAKPWLAEIKVDRTNNPKKWYRIYFGDLADQSGEVPNRMLACGAHTKKEGSSVAITSKAQTLSMVVASNALIWWCLRRGVRIGYRLAD